MFSHNKGLTRWEIVIVVGVIGILAGMALPSFQNYHQPTTELSASEPHEPTQEADHFLQNMLPANIVFNAPESMEVGQTHTIELLLSLNKDFDLLTESMTNVFDRAVNVETAVVQVSNVVEAKLTGQKFKILAVAEEKQAITKTHTTQWKWEIEALESGSHTLYLVLNTSITVDGEKIPRTIRTFDRDIQVTVTLDNQIKSFIANHWQWLWVTILVPAVGFLARFLWRLWKNRSGD